jgi:hypothetical protein
MGIVRSRIAAGGTIKEGLHKTPTTVCVPQLFDAQHLSSSAAQLILHEIPEKPVEKTSLVDAEHDG